MSARPSPARCARSLYHLRCTVFSKGREGDPASLYSHFSKPCSLRTRARGIEVRRGRPGPLDVES